ncbi:aminopeptidase N [Brevibacterium daeguense]|uniref:Aminopeptidase N n=1 Tax=Brevibacterium daeguense TaxID=909936 RepID=A0ABP8EGX5_9MICO|nr:aminopeptidase N [Brevibacterium daeguense]
MTTNLTREEARARTALLEVSRYFVVLDLSGAADRERTTFDSTTTVEFTARSDSDTFIDLIAEEVVRVTVNGTALDPAQVFDGARLRFPVRAGDNVLEVHAHAAYSRTGEGLHRFFDPADDKVYLYTQYEPTDARRVFANFDQPDLKARFSFTVLAPDDFTVLGNSSAATAGAAGPGVTRHVFEPTRVQSSYITCIAAGHYAAAHSTYRHPSTGEEIPLGVYARASLAAHMDAESIFRVTAQGLDFFHAQFDYPYPWGKYDQIFVPEYNLGAMENPGLVTFTDSLIFRDKVTRAMHESRAGTILHEMAHMWFGDLVTMEWWDDLWLKESFADYMGTLALAEATEYSDAWVTFALRRKDWAYRQDQYPTTHPIVADIPDVEAAKLNFDGITYAKGASVLVQLVAFVGKDAFLAGSRSYFRAHEFGTASLADFLETLAAAAPQRDVRRWAETWLTTTGVSEIALAVESDQAGVMTGGRLRQRNSDPEAVTGSAAGAGDSNAGLLARAGDSNAGLPARAGDSGAGLPTRAGASDAEVVRPHRLTLAGFSRRGSRLVLTETWPLDFAVESCDVPELGGTRRPDLLLLNHGDHDYCKVRLDEVSTATALRSVTRLPDPLDRALVWSALTNALRDGLLPVPEFLIAYTRALAKEPHAGIAAGLRAQMLTTLDRWISPWDHSEAVAGVLGAALDALAAAPAGSDAQLDRAGTVLSLVRRTAEPDVTGPAVTAGREFASQILATPVGSTMTGETSGLVADHSLRWQALTALICLGWADLDDIRREAAADNTGTGALHAAAATAAQPLAIAKMRAFTDATERTDLSNDMISARIAGFTSPAGLPLTEGFVEPYFELLGDIWQTRSIEIARRLVVGLYPHWSLHPEHVLTRTDAWLEDHPEAPAAQRRLLVELRHDLLRSIRLRQAPPRRAARGSGSERATRRQGPPGTPRRPAGS